MFDIGFWELGLIFLIGLIVLGPERLPKVARTLGKWVRRARGYASNLTSELERELDVDEMREHFKQTGRHLKRTGDDFQSQVTDLRDSVESASGSATGKRDHFRRARAAKAPATPAPAETQDNAAADSDASKTNDNE